MLIRVFSKSTISKLILPHLSTPKRGGSSTNLWEIVNAILYKLKSGVQWHLLPLNSLIYRPKIKYSTIYHHFRKWISDGSWSRCFENLVGNHKELLDLSCAHFDGTHTPCKKGGEQVAYQHRKKAKTSNQLWLTDQQGLPVSFCNIQSGNHHDLFQIKEQMDTLENRLQKSKIELDGLVINADAGFDSKAFRKVCFQKGIEINMPINKRNNRELQDDDYYFDQETYDSRYVVERTNAWMDSYRTLLYRFDVTLESWNAWNTIGAIAIWTKFILKL